MSDLPYNGIKPTLDLPLNQTTPINIPTLPHHSHEKESPNVPNTPPPTPELSSLPPPPPPPQQAPEPPKYLDSKFIEMALRKKYPDLQVINLHLVPAVGVGENYMSLVFRADVGTSQGPFGLIIKCIPETEFRAKFVNDNGFTEREMAFYHTILPTLHANLPEDSELKASTPLCYFSIHEGLIDAIVLQDLRPYGYRTHDRKVGLNKQHCKLALKELAKLHALSINLRIKNPELFKKEIFVNFSENMYREKNRDLFESFLNTSLEQIALGVREYFPYRYHELTYVMDQIRKHVFDLMCDLFKFPDDTSKTILVLNHGDFWNNNILFQYENKNDKEPLACVLIDFQVSKCGPPVLDLLYFFYTSTVQETRQECMDELLQYYFEQVTTNLCQLGAPQPLPPYMFYNSVAEIKEALSEYAIFGFISATHIMPIVVANTEDAPDMDTMTEESIKTDLTAFTKLYAGALFKKRFREVLEDFDDLGFFDRYSKIAAQLNDAQRSDIV